MLVLLNLDEVKPGTSLTSLDPFFMWTWDM